MAKTASRNEFDKIHIVSQRLQSILERDGLRHRFLGAEDYLVRAVIEALGLSEIFYDAGFVADDESIYKVFLITLHVGSRQIVCIVSSQYDGDASAMAVTYCGQHYNDETPHVDKVELSPANCATRGVLYAVERNT